ncbi:hypothetical protein ACSFBF_08125 [Variovorax sp. ZT5P49]|uniref:hypothetical protein n=1 Tax=Variovorax sp. ZT5P49 TaxID=3443733 RepID=UPI003F465309
MLFTEDEWNAAIPGVVAAMTDFLHPYRTAIYEHKGEYGEGWGSGSFLRLGDKVFILTNQHIARIREESRMLAYQLDGQEDIRAIAGNHTAECPWPLNLAVLPVDIEAWPDATNKSRPITVEQIELWHDPVPTELLAFTGFAGQNTSFHYNTLFSKGTCYTAREIEPPQDERFSSRFTSGWTIVLTLHRM